MPRHSTPRKRTGLIIRPRLLGMLLAATMLVYSVTPLGRDFFALACYELGFNDRRAEAGPLEIHVIDVGKADALLIRSGGSAALIDAGKPGSADTVADYLIRHNVRALDYLIMSHPDSDHIGGMRGLLEDIDVKAFVRAGTGYAPEEDSGLAALTDSLERKGVCAELMSPGDSIALGQAVLTAVGPVGSFPDANNSSLVLRLDCLGFSALFCGDMEREAEQALILSGQDIDVDLLKVAHHGSDTSSGIRFLLETSPKYAAISTALDRNLLPKDEVLKRLEDAGAEIYRTDTDGNIVFIFDGTEVRVRLDREEHTTYETVDNRPF